MSETTGTSAPSGTQQIRSLITALGMLPVLILLAVGFHLMTGKFLSVNNLSIVMQQASINIVLAAGMTFVILTGGIDLSVGSTLAAAAMGAVIMSLVPGLGWLGILAGLGIGLIFGLANGALIAFLALPPFIVTLGTLVAGRGIGLLLTESRGVILPNELFDFGSGSTFGIPNPILVFLVIAVVGHLILSRTVMGRHIYAVGYDAATAKKAGIPVNRTLGSVYLVSGFCAALGGFVSVSQLGIVNAGFGEFSELYAIAAAVLGGTSLFGGIGSILPGTVLGAVLIQMVQSGLVFVRVDIYLQPIIQAAIIFFAVLLDSIRSRKLADLGKRRIRIEEETTGG